MFDENPFDGSPLDETSFDESQWRGHRYHRDDPLEPGGGWPDWVEPPFPPVDLGPCPACGQATRRYYTSLDPFYFITDYVCLWCRARMMVFHTGAPGHTFEPTYPYYAPPTGRWEQQLGGDPYRSHAMDYWGVTLCGLDPDGFTDYGVIWTFEAADACPSCQTAAVQIDERWPADRRISDDDIPAYLACPCPACRAADPGRRR